MLLRIKERLYSSNIIERGIKLPDGKVKWEPFIAPLCKKEEGDVICNDLYIKLLEKYG